MNEVDGYERLRAVGCRPVVYTMLCTQKTEVGSANRKRCAASACATTLKILRRKRFCKLKRIIAPQAHAQM